MTNEEGNGTTADLRPVIARLKEIERKCDSMGSRNEEFPLMKDRLQAIIARLEAGEEPSGEPLAYRCAPKLPHDRFMFRGTRRSARDTREVLVITQLRRRQVDHGTQIHR